MSIYIYYFIEVLIISYLCLLSRNNFLLNVQLLGSFVDILGKMAIDNDLSAVVICSEGDDFCRGLDIGAFLKMSGVDRDNYSKNLAKYAR